MIKKIKKARRKHKYFRGMNYGLDFLSRLDVAVRDMPKQKQKQFWRDIKSPVSRVRVFKEIFEALNK